MPSVWTSKKAAIIIRSAVLMVSRNMPFANIGNPVQTSARKTGQSMVRTTCCQRLWAARRSTNSVESEKPEIEPQNTQKKKQKQWKTPSWRCHKEAQSGYGGGRGPSK